MKTWAIAKFDLKACLRPKSALTSPWLRVTCCNKIHDWLKIAAFAWCWKKFEDEIYKGLETSTFLTKKGINRSSTLKCIVGAFNMKTHGCDVCEY